ncbi:hypothetical protein [Nocardia sp. NPDC005366]|uniref:hypothetical protein n=1 Tax=Nocardia sp. NPDC005366 TaxID=3156878 RepID=UPI0033A60BA8
MKRISVIVVAAGAVALMLTGCGGSKETSDASGLRKGTTDTSATSSARPTSTAIAPTSASGSPSTTPSASTPADAPAGRASDTTCAQFKGLDSTGEKALIEEILAENPDSPFAGSPNVALGTAKLVCLSSSNANKPVAVAAGIVVKH